MVIKENHVAFGLDSFIYLFMNEDGSPRREDCPRNVVIDMANGHMYKLCKVAETAKKHYPNMRLTVGNVASPETFENLCSVGVDGIRLGIGNGSVCTTSKKTGVFYPLGSLIQECADVKEKWDYHTDIIADGGFDSFPRIIKALGLGANRVMLGGMLNIALESAGTTRIGTCGEVIAPYSDRAQKLFKDGVHLTKEYYGMSTHKAQKGIDDACVLKPEEGYSMAGRKVQYTVEQLCASFGGALRSAMSYAGKRMLKDFIGGVDFIRVSGSAYVRHEGNIHG
jgi:IMP dehydrogenase/GMP reductase